MDGQGSSSNASSNDASTDQQKILLYILSPSFGVPNRTTFRDILTSTTVGELKKMICDVIPSKPSPQSQRLIYRGRALIQDGLTLKDVFTQETIDQSEALSLHLVLPPANAVQSTASQASSTSPTPDRRENTHGMPLRISGNERLSNNQSSINVTITEPEAVQDRQEHADPAMLHSQHDSSQHILSQLPLSIQQAMQNHFATLVQQTGGQPQPSGGPMTGREPVMQSQPQRQTNLDSPTQQQQNSLEQLEQQQLAQQQHLAQQRQILAAATLHGLHHHRSVDGQRPQGITAAQAPIHGMPSQANGLPLGGLPVNGRIVQENRGPNGEHWRMIIERTQTVGHQPHHHHHHHHHHHAHNNPNQRPGSSTPTSSVHGIPSSVSSRISTPQTPGSPRISPDPQQSANPRSGQSSQSPQQLPQPQQTNLEQNLASIQNALSEGTTPNEPRLQAARALLQRVASQGDISNDAEIALRARVEQLSTQADQLQASLNSLSRRFTSEQPPTQRSTITSPGPTPGPPPSLHISSLSSIPPSHVSSPSNTLYLLSSPSGPHALLVSPSGMYATPWHIPLPTNAPLNPVVQHVSTVSSSQPTNVTEGINPRQPPENPPQAIQAQQQQQQQEQQLNQQMNQARDLIRLLIPLGGHLWLLVRLFGFVYFFTGGGGYRRAILLGLGALLVFIAQTGLFRPFLQSVWEPFRRHVENLLPLAANERPPPIAAAPGNNANALAAPEAPRGNAMPTPQQTAERLLREHENRDGGIIRQNLRRLERAVALFLGSLVPGVGERHIAARDAIRAVRRELERARQEIEDRSRERENESAQTQGQDAAGSPAPGPGPTDSQVERPTGQASN